LSRRFLPGQGGDFDLPYQLLIPDLLTKKSEADNQSSPGLSQSTIENSTIKNSRPLVFAGHRKPTTDH